MHKVLGPTGMGVLYGKKHLLSRMAQFLSGGETVTDSTYTSAEIARSPDKFEAGLQNCPGVMGLAAALKTIESIGQDNINSHTASLNEFTTEQLLKIPAISIVGPQSAHKRGVILSFRVDGMEARPLAKRLNDEFNVMVRAGKNCVHYWFSTRGGGDVIRASFGPYNTIEECEIFCNAMRALAG